MKEIRAMGGFVAANGMHYNPRVAVMPSEDLTRFIYPWVDECLEEVLQFERSTGESKGTGTGFLKLLMKLRVVVLQDAAVYLIEHQDMCTNHLFFKHHVFQTAEFMVSLTG
jgi:Centromere DNA-binding protein complex CBF3 subunit, domain 2